MKIIYKIQNMIDCFEEIPYFLKRLIKWIPILWQDRWFDHRYIYKILQFKLQDTYDHTLHEGCWSWKYRNKSLKQLWICIKLLDRILDESDYLDLATSEFRPWETENSYEEVMNNLRRPKTKKERYYFLKHADHCWYLEKQDYRMLHKMMNRYSRNWWD